MGQYALPPPPLNGRGSPRHHPSIHPQWRFEACVGKLMDGWMDGARDGCVPVGGGSTDGRRRVDGTHQLWVFFCLSSSRRPRRNRNREPGQKVGGHLVHGLFVLCASPSFVPGGRTREGVGEGGATRWHMAIARYYFISRKDGSTWCTQGIQPAQCIGHTNANVRMNHGCPFST